MMGSYEAVLPPGWVMLDLGLPFGDSLDQAVVAMLSGVPTEIADSLRRNMLKQLRTEIENLAKEGAAAVYLPTDDMLSAVVRPLIVVRPVTFEVEGKQVPPLDFLAGLISQEGTALVEPEGMIGVKRVTEFDSSTQFAKASSRLPAEVLDRIDQQAFGQAVADGRRTRRITYIVGVPDSAERWMAVDASVSVLNGDGAEEALEAVEEFFDAWVCAVRWEVTVDE